MYVRIGRFELAEDEHLRAPRDSMFLLAALRFENQDGEHSVKIRNLSNTGLMAEGEVHVRPGSIVTINIRNIGWVGGIVAWTEDKRFGVMFDTEIDPRKARTAV